MDFETNTATNPERSDETRASRSEQNRERRLGLHGGNALRQKLRKREKRA